MKRQAPEIQEANKTSRLRKLKLRKNWKVSPQFYGRRQLWSSSLTHQQLCLGGLFHDGIAWTSVLL